MTTFKKGKKNILRNILLGGVLLVTLFFGGKQADAFLKTDGGSSINKLFLAPLSVIKNSSSVFSGASFGVFGSSFLEKLYTTGETIFEKGLRVGFASPQAAEVGGDVALKVNGPIIVRELGHPDCKSSETCDSIADTRLCSNDFGVLERCDQGVCWDKTTTSNISCYTDDDCTETFPFCKGTNIDTEAVTAKPGSCYLYSSEYDDQPAKSNATGCQVGTYKDIADEDLYYKWTCLGIDGGSDIDCSAKKHIVLDEIGVGERGSLDLNNSLTSFFSIQRAEASSSICSERNNLNENGVYKRIGSIFVRGGDKLVFLTPDGEEKVVDYAYLKEHSTMSNSEVRIYVDGDLSSVIEDGEYLISGDDVINEDRDPLQETDGINIPHGTPISAVSLVAQNGIYTFDVCNDIPDLSRDEIRKKDIKTIQQQLEKYYDEHGRYPISSGADIPNTSWSSSLNSSSWESIRSQLGVNILPSDPLNERNGTSWPSEYTYKYYSPETTAYGCEAGQWYMINYTFEDKSELISSKAESCSRDFNYSQSMTVGSCKDPACNSRWKIGEWSVCDVYTGIQTRSVACYDSNNQETNEINCWENDKPTIEQACRVNAVCKNISGSQDTDPVSGNENACVAGTFSDQSDLRATWRWQCKGLNGGADASCSAIRTTYDWFSEPWETCNTQTGIQDREVYCKSSTGNKVDDSYCTETKPVLSQTCAVPGSCKEYSNSYDPQPVSNSNNACNQGTFIESDDTANEWRWRCQGLNGGTTLSCTATRTTYSWVSGNWGTCNLTNGIQSRSVICKASTGETVADAKCGSGKPSLTQNCAVAGSCKTIIGSHDTQPVSNSASACEYGVYTDMVDQPSQWRWQCQGLNGGTTSTCSAIRTTYSWQTGLWSNCNLTNGIQTRSVICKSSTGNIMTGSNESRCTETKPAISQNCAVPGICKVYGSTYENQPANATLNGCMQGTFVENSDTSSQFRWFCSGLNGGATVGCSAKKINQNPIAEYRFDECRWGGRAGDTSNDETGGTDLVVKGRATIANPGKIGNAGYFDGESYLEIPNATYLNSYGKDKFSISLWFNWDGTTNQNILINKESEYMIGLNSGVLQYAWRPYWRWFGNVSVTANTWMHVVVTYDGEKQRMYKNGTLVYERSQTGLMNLKTNYPLRIGSRGSTGVNGTNVSSYFHGQIDEVKIYNDRLSTNMVKALYDKEKNLSRTKTCLTNDEYRKQDIAFIKEELEKYYNKNGYYPNYGSQYNNNAQEPNNGWVNSSTDKWKQLENALGVTLYRDPINTKEGSGSWVNAYRYYYFSNGYGCDGQWYMLYHKLEATPNKTVGNINSCNYKFTYNRLIGTGECKSPACNSSWKTGVWSSCAVNGTQTRTATCVDSNGNSTAESNCTGKGYAKPATIQNCSLDASCKAYGSSYTSQPATDTAGGCLLGTYLDLSDYTTQYRWQCKGLNGGANKVCLANKKLNGVCGATHTKTYGVRPSATCSTGSAAWTDSVGTDGQWNWTCSGVNGGSSVSCYAKRVLNGQCKIYNSSYDPQPATSTSSGCIVGTYTDVANETTKYHWQCKGINGGTISNCSATRTTYAWVAGSWSNCSSSGTQTRSVICRASTGSTVANTKCSGAIPITTQNCARNGVCGSNHTKTFTSRPSANCSIGSAAWTDSVGTDGQWNWTCKGLNGGSNASCYAKWKRNGSCKSYTSNYTSQPATSTSTGCSIGGYVNLPNTSTVFKWKCNGINGGIEAVCSAKWKRNAVCKTYSAAYTQSASSTSTGCITGTYANITNTSTQFKWTCAGVNSGSTASCSQTIKKNAVCGSTRNTCFVGVANDAAVTDTTTYYKWQCTGVAGGTSIACQYHKPINGVCNNNVRNSCSSGTANDGAISDTSTYYRWRCDASYSGSNSGTCQYHKPINGVCNNNVRNSCSSGTANDGAISDTSTYYRWRCDASYGGSNSGTCQYHKPINAVCKSYTSNYTSQPATSTSTGCTRGNYTNVSNISTAFRWSCSGVYGGSAVTCSAKWKRNGSCKSYTSNYTSQPATSTSTGCTRGNYTNVSNTSTAFRWSCSGINGGSTTTCSAKWKRNGVCASSNNTCSVGTVVDTTDSSTQYKWTCVGYNGGTTASCTKNKSLSGVCKSYTSNYTSQPATSTSTGCTRGNYTNVSNTSTAFRWSCSGINGGSTTTCSAKWKRNGVCASSNNTCSVGTVVDTTDSGDYYKWTCVGHNSGTAATCTKAKSCPTPTITSLSGNKIYFNKNNGSRTVTAVSLSDSTSPTATTNTFTDSPSSPRIHTLTHGHYYRVKNHCSGGINSSFSAAVQYSPSVNGVCGSINGQSLTKTLWQHVEIQSKCSKGSFIQVDNIGSDGRFNWTCKGSNGGTHTTCSAFRKTEAVCKNYYGTYSFNPAYSTSTGCTQGIYTHQSLFLIDAGDDPFCTGIDGCWMWGCRDSDAPNIGRTCVADKSPGAGGGGGGCFTAGTKVAMADGSFKDIKDIQLGEMILSSYGSNKVMIKYEIDYIGKLYSINGSNYFVSDSHPFMTTEGWKSFNPYKTRLESPGLKVGLLNKGDILIRANGDYQLVSEFSYITTQTKVYNFGLNGSRDFYAEGYLVHNVNMKPITFIKKAMAKNIDDPGGFIHEL